MKTLLLDCLCAWFIFIVRLELRKFQSHRVANGFSVWYPTKYGLSAPGNVAYTQIRSCDIHGYITEGGFVGLHMVISGVVFYDICITHVGLLRLDPQRPCRAGLFAHRTFLRTRYWSLAYSHTLSPPQPRVARWSCWSDLSCWLFARLVRSQGHLCCPTVRRIPNLYIFENKFTL